MSPRRRISTVLLATLLASVAVGVGSTAQTSPRVVNDRCPVMEDEPALPGYEVQFRGVAVRFCCNKCQDKFAEDPLPYLSHLPQLPAATVQAAIAEAHQSASA